MLLFFEHATDVVSRAVEFESEWLGLRPGLERETKKPLSMTADGFHTVTLVSVIDLALIKVYSRGT